MTFLLGFYVSLVVKRWWEQYTKLPWPDKMAILLRGLVKDKVKIFIMISIFLIELIVKFGSGISFHAGNFIIFNPIWTSFKHHNFHKYEESFIKPNYL